MIQSILWGRDVVALMATGMGKSVTYQLPSLAIREMTGMKPVTLVVSPLISLMDDQVAGLKANGASALMPAVSRQMRGVFVHPNDTTPGFTFSDPRHAAY